MDNIGNDLLNNDAIFFLVVSCLFCNIGGCEFAQSSKAFLNCWVRYLTIETYTLYLPRPVRNRLMHYPKYVRRVSISYPNVWTKVPPLLYESSKTSCGDLFMIRHGHRSFSIHPKEINVAESLQVHFSFRTDLNI